MMDWKEEVSEILFAAGCYSMSASFELCSDEADEAVELGHLLMDAADALAHEAFEEKKALRHEKRA